MNYSIVLAKDLQLGDTIIHNSHKVTIIGIALGSGAGSFDFGEYLTIDVQNSNYDVEREIWTFRECPWIVVSP